MQSARKQSLVLALLPVLLLILGLRAAEPARAQTPATDSPIIAAAMQHVGTHGGQCYIFVRDAVRQATGAQIGKGYRDGFFAAGAVEIDPANARAGDILQISNPSNQTRYYPGMHTVLVVENHGGGRYTVVDSNSRWDEMVRVHEWTPQPRAGLKLYGYRIGGGTPEVIPPAPELDAGQSARVDTGDGSRLNVRSGQGLAAGIIDQLSDGTPVTVLQEGSTANGYTWVKVSASGVEGWVAAQFLSGVEAAAPATPAATPAPAVDTGDTTAIQTALVSTDGSCLNLRGGPGLDREIKTCMLDGTRVTVTGATSVDVDGYTWVEVESASGTGWVADEYLVLD